MDTLEKYLAKIHQYNESHANDASSNRDSGVGRKELSGFDRTFAEFSKLGEGIANLSGFQDAQADEIINEKDAITFLMSLPTGMMSAPFSGVSKIYEGFTGRPVQEADFDTMTMPDYQISDEGRTSAIIDATIDLAGLGFGGTGRVIGTGIQGARKLMGRPLNDIGRGFFKNTFGSTGLQVGSDILEEGAEEFAQSYLGEIRGDEFMNQGFGNLDDDSFGRALQAGGLGALGGGIMSGSMAVANTALRGDAKSEMDKIGEYWGNVNKNINQNQDPYAALIPYTSFNMAEQVNQAGTQGELVPSVAEYEREQFSEGNEVPGSNTMKAVADNSLTIDEAIYGIRGLQAMYNMNDEGKSKKELADAFKMNADELGRILFSRNRVEAIQLINKQIGKLGGRVQAQFGRNPDTARASIQEKYITRIDDSNKISLAPETGKSFGGDFDADAWQIYFGGKQNSIGFLSDYILSPNNQATLDFKYVATPTGRYAKRIIKDAFGNLFRNSQLGEKFTDEYMAIAEDKSDDKDRDLELSKYFNRVREYAIKNNLTKDPRGLIAKMIQALGTVNSFESVFTEGVGGQTKHIESLYKDLKPSKEPQRYDSGSTESYADLAQWLNQLGFITYTRAIGDNPIFRTSSTLVYSMNKIHMMADTMSALPTTDAITSFIAEVMNLEQEGAVIENTVQTLFQVRVMGRTLDETGINESKRIGNDKERLKEFTDAFNKAYNETADEYNAAIEKMNMRGETFIPLDLSPKGHADSPASRARYFTEIFGDTFVTDIFATTDPNMENQTINQLAEEILDAPGNFKDRMAELGKETNDFFVSLIDNYQGRAQALNTAITKAAEAAKDVPSNAMVPTAKGNQTYNPDHKQQLTWVLDAFCRLVDPKIAIKARVASLNTVMRTPWGKHIFSGDPDSFLNASVSVSMFYSFEDTIGAMATYERETNEAKKAEALKRAQEAAAQNLGVSRLHTKIAEMIIKYGDVRLLDAVVDLNVKLSDKISSWDDIQLATTKDYSHPTPLLVDALRTEDTRLEVSVISKRLKKVKNSFKSAERNARDACMKGIEEMEEDAKSNTSTDAAGQMYASVEDIASVSFTGANLDFLVGVIEDSAPIARRELSEKGKAPTSWNLQHQMAEYVHGGGPKPYMTQITDGAFSRMTKSDFTRDRNAMLSVLFGWGKVWVYDPITKQDVLMTQKGLYAELGMTIGDKPSMSNFIALLRKFPHVYSWIAPPSYSATAKEPATVKPYQSRPLHLLIREHRDNLNSNNRKAGARREKLAIEAELLNRPEYIPAIIASIRNIDSLLSSRRDMRKAVEDAHKALINHFYHMVHVGTGRPLNRDTLRKEFIRLGNERIMDEIYKAIDYSRVAMDLLSNGKSLDEASKRQLGNIWKSQIYNSNLGNILKKKGYSLVELELDSMVNDLSSIDHMAAMAESQAKDAILDIDTSLELYAAIVSLTEDPEYYMDLKADNKVTTLIDAKLNNLSQAIQLAREDKDKTAVASFQKQYEDLSKARDEASTFDYAKEIRNLDIFKLAMMPEDLNSFEKISSKVKGIADYIGTKNDYQKELNRLHDRVFDPKSEDYEKLEYQRGIILQTFKTRWNNRIIDKTIKQKIPFASALSENYVEATFNLNNFIMRTVDEMIARKDEFPTLNYSTEGGPEYDRIDFYLDNPTNMTMASQALQAAEGGRVTSQVSVDSSIDKLLTTFGWLPRNMYCGVPPRTMTLREFFTLGHQGNLRWHYEDDNGEVGVINQPLINEWFKDYREGREHDVKLYHPDDCTCGCSRHTEASAVDPDSNWNGLYLAVPTIVAEIDAWAAENRSLQFKKVTGFLERVIETVSKADGVDKPFNTTTHGNREAMWQELGRRKLTLSKFYNREFKAATGLKMNVSDHITFAQLTTRGARITFKDKIIVNDKEVNSMIISAKHLATDEAFAEWMEKYPINWDDVNFMEAFVVSPREIAAKIAADCAPEATRLLMKEGDGEGVSVEELGKMVMVSLEDWSGYGSGTLSMTEVFSSAVPISRGLPSMLTKSSDPSVGQKFRRLIAGSRANSSMEQKTIKDVGNDTRDLIESVNKDLGVPSPYKIVHSFINSTNRAESKLKVKNGAMLQRLAHLSNTPGLEGPAYAAACWSHDKDEIEAQYILASRSDQVFFIPEDSRSEVLQIFKKDGVFVEDAIVYFGGHNWLKIDTEFANDGNYLDGRRLKSPIVKKPPKSYTTLVAARNDSPLILGDSGGILSQDMTDHFRDWANFVDIDLGATLTGTSAIETVNKEDVLLIRSQIDSKEAEFKLPEFETFSEEAVMRAVDKALDERATFAKKDYLALENVNKDECIGFMRQYDNDRGITYYMPIILAEMPMPETGNTVLVRHNGKMLSLMLQNSRMHLSLEEGQKIFLQYEAYKSYMSIASDDQQQRLPYIGKTIDGKMIRASGVYNGDTEDSRLIDMTDFMIKSNMYNHTRIYGADLFMQQDPVSKKWSRKDEFAHLDEGVLATLMERGNRDIWWDVANGKIKLFDPANVANEELNRIVAIVAMDCLQHDVPPAIFFRNIQHDADGTAVAIHDNVPDERMILRRLDTKQAYRLFNAMRNDICYPDSTKPVKRDLTEKPWFNEKGEYLIEWPLKDDKGEWTRHDSGYSRVRIAQNFFGDDTTAISNPSAIASISNQHRTRRAFYTGITQHDLKDSVEFVNSVVLNDWGAYSRDIDLENLPEIKKTAGYKDVDKYVMSPDLMELPFHNMQTQEHDRQIANVGKSYDKYLNVIDDKGDIIDEDNKKTTKKMKSLKDDLKDALGLKGLSDLRLHNLVKWQTGFSDNDGSGSHTITYGQFENAVKQMVDNLKRGKYLISGGRVKGDRNRISTPRLPKQEAMALFRESPILKAQYHEDFNEFDAAAVEEQKVTKSLLDIPDIPAPKRLALRNIVDFVSTTYGEPPASGHLYNDYYYGDMLTNNSKMLKAIMPPVAPGIAERYLALEGDTIRRIDNARKVVEDAKYSRFTTSNFTAGEIVDRRSARVSAASKAFRNATSISKVLALASPMTPVANVVERNVYQGITRAALFAGRKGIGPYSGGVEVNQDLIKQIAQKPEVRKIYESIRMLQLLGSDIELTANIKTLDDLNSYLDARLKDLGWFERVNDRVYRIATGWDFGLSGQIRNFFNRFAQQSEGRPWLTETMKVKDEEGKTKEITLLEQVLTANPEMFLFDVLTGAKNSPDYLIARQSMEFAKRGDAAQRNIVSLFWSEITAKYALPDFALTTFVTRFPQYQINKMGRMLEFIAPMSVINYVAIQFASQTRKGQELGVDELQLMSFKEACIIDSLHLVPQAIALLLAMIPGMIEPPEDEDKWFNFEEWTIFGIRINTEWWVEDILGPAVPLAISMKSLTLGRPTGMIMVNWLAQIAYNNPMMRVADIVTSLFDPEESFISDYNEDAMDYLKAQGGSPSATDVASSGLISFGLNWISQFITPAIVKELWNDSQEFEHSYKRIYEENEAGHLTEEGMAGKTMRTTYQDAQLRKITRRNPAMGLIFDTILQPNTSYITSRMPRTVYYDPDQMNSIKALSMVDEFGNERSDADKEAVAAQVILELESYNDMDALYKTGFMISGDTRAFVSKVIWDIIKKEKDRWADLIADGGTDAYYLGDGDFNTGYALAQELKNEHNTIVEHYEDLYYNKLWSEQMRHVAQYNRYNTTYAQDAKGEWYATGFKPVIGLPLSMAPGESDPNGYQHVMSAENDWATESLVSGESTGLRALVPVAQTFPDVPDMESWGSEKNNGYSDSYRGDTGASSSGYTSRTSSSGYSSGGGGGRSTPNIYSHLPNINTSTPRTMNADRLYDTEFDYLRPDFYTKGSREAYQRRDM
jgi:hypothetical protein